MVVQERGQVVNLVCVGSDRKQQQKREDVVVCPGLKGASCALSQKNTSKKANRSFAAFRVYIAQLFDETRRCNQELESMARPSFRWGMQRKRDTAVS